VKRILWKLASTVEDIFVSMPAPKLQTFSHPYISCAQNFESCLIQYFIGEGQPVLLIAVANPTALFSTLSAEPVFTANNRRHQRLLLPAVRRSDKEFSLSQFESYVLLQTISTGCLTYCMYWGNSRRIAGDWNGGVVGVLIM